MKTVVGLYDQLEDATQTVQDLRSSGFRAEDVSIISRDAEGEYSRFLGGDRPAEAEDISDGTAAGAGIGAVLGGLGGLLVGLGALAIPGIGPVLAAGPLISALAGAGIGAVAGGLVGALVDLGIPEEHANVYAEGLRRGATLIVARTDDLRADEVMTIMNRHNPVDIERQSETWRQSDWSRFNAEAEPLTSDRMEFNRRQRRENMDYSADRDMMDIHDEEEMRDTETIMPVTGSVMDTEAVEEDVAMEDDRPFDDAYFNSVTRPHFQSTYQSSGRAYEDYEPAYRFGYDLANDSRYREYDWMRLEPEARRTWESRGLLGAWDDVKDAVRHAWNSLKY